MHLNKPFTALRITCKINQCYKKHGNVAITACLPIYIHICNLLTVYIYKTRKNMPNLSAAVEVHLKLCMHLWL